MQVGTNPVLHGAVYRPNLSLVDRTIPPSEELERRIRAAAGYSLLSLEAFTEAVGIGHSTLYRVFNGERHLKRMEAREMAQVAQLPIEFFWADFGLLGDRTRAAISATRGVTREAQARAVGDPSTIEAADGTHGSEDASQEGAPARPAAKP